MIIIESQSLDTWTMKHIGIILDSMLYNIYIYDAMVVLQLHAMTY